MKLITLPSLVCCCLLFFLQPACVQKNPVNPPPPPPLKLLRPASGQTFVSGDTVAIAWQTTAAFTSSVYVSVSTNNGKNWFRISAGGFSAADSCTWVIGKELDRSLLTYPSDSVRITIRDSAGDYRDSTRGCLRAHALLLTKPVGGQTLHIGDTVSIAWRGDPMLISSIKVLVSTDNDKTESLVAGISFAAGDSCRWIVGHENQPLSPAYPSDSVVIVVRDYDDLYSDRNVSCLKVVN
jgi:hypothetical protein